MHIPGYSKQQVQQNHIEWMQATKGNEDVKTTTAVSYKEMLDIGSICPMISNCMSYFRPNRALLAHN